MHGSILKMFFLLCILALGGMFLFWAGLLPKSVYPAIYRITDTLPWANQASHPYYQKYEGHWTFVVTPGKQPPSAFFECPAFSTTIIAHNAYYTGRASIPGYLLGIEASTTVSGVLQGTLYSGNRHYIATLQGLVNGEAGSGSWKDNQDCIGTWSLVKLSTVVDPIQGKTTLLTGRVLLTRNGVTEEVWPQQQLYAGDIIKVPPNGEATLELGPSRTRITIPAGTSYTIKNATGAAK